MHKGIRIIGGVTTAFLVLTILHLWLNIGFERLGFGKEEGAAAPFRVGYLPVT